MKEEYINYHPSGTFIPDEKRTPSNAYQGAKYFSYNGQVLDDLRKQFEQKSIEND